MKNLPTEGRGALKSLSAMSESPRDESLDIDLGNKRIRASGNLVVVALIVMLLVAVASVAPTIVVFRAVGQVSAEMKDGFHRMGVQHDKLVDLQEAAAYTFMPPEIQKRMALPKWVRNRIEEQAQLPAGPSDVRRETPLPGAK